MLELAGELEMEVEASDGIVRVVESALSLPFTSWYWCGDNDLDHVGNDCVAGTGLVVGEVDPTCVLTVEADSLPPLFCIVLISFCISIYFSRIPRD